MELVLHCKLERQEKGGHDSGIIPRSKLDSHDALLLPHKDDCSLAEQSSSNLHNRPNIISTKRL